MIAALLLAGAAAAAPAPEIVSLKTSDGWTLTADYRPPTRGGAVVVLAHGVASSRGEWTAFAERLQAAGIGPGPTQFLHGTQRSGGAHFLMADGAVRFVSQNIDQETLRRLADPMDGQPVGEF